MKSALNIYKLIKKAMMYLALFIMTIIMAYPFIWLFSSSLKPLDEIFANPLAVVGNVVTLDNFKELFTKYNFALYFFNSTYISVFVTLGAVFFCSLAGYAFSKFQFKGKEVLFLIVLGSMMIPFESTMIPLYYLYRKFHWIDKQIGLIIPFMANAFGIFFMKQFIDGISSEIIESGRIDGCGEFRIFRKLILPIITPAIASLSIILFMNSWNNFLWPLIVLKSSDKFTLAVALRNFEMGVRSPYNLIFAGSVVSIVPLIIVFIGFQKQFIAGITAGAIKG